MPRRRSVLIIQHNHNISKKQDKYRHTCSRHQRGEGAQSGHAMAASPPRSSTRAGRRSGTPKFRGQGLGVSVRGWGLGVRVQAASPPPSCTRAGRRSGTPKFVYGYTNTIFNIQYPQSCLTFQYDLKCDAQTFQYHLKRDVQTSQYYLKCDVRRALAEKEQRKKRHTPMQSNFAGSVGIE